MDDRILLSTRGSPLALWQAEHARDALRAVLPGKSIELMLVRTSGDDVQDRSIVAMGATGVFTVEVDRAVSEGRAHSAVHSLKDLATKLDGDLVLATTLPRGAVEDVLVSPKYGTLAALPRGARVATGSLRRRAMLLRLRPDLVCVDIRGFVGTRLEKLKRGDADAMLMARAGLERLGLGAMITEIMPVDSFLPAVGQALVGITCRGSNQPLLDAWQRAGDAAGLAQGVAERALLSTLRAGCHAPVGGYATVAGQKLTLRGRVLAKDGSYEVAGEMTGGLGAAQELGEALAQKLLAEGAGALLGT